MFAVIPLIFAFQQIMEGWVWLTLTNSDYRQWQRIPVTMFLFLAQVVWPLWVPLSMLKIESNPRLRLGLKILCYCSVVAAPLQAYRLIFNPPAVELRMHHIYYGLDLSILYLGATLNVFYFLTTIVPPFLSSRRSVVTLGIFNLVAFVIAMISFRSNIISVWCFFAALISCQVIRIMNGMRDKLSLER